MKIPSKNPATKVNRQLNREEQTATAFKQKKEVGSDSSDVASTIDKAEIAYKKCWEILVWLKERTTSQITASNLRLFQPTLAQALFDLDACYSQLLIRKELLIGEKEHLDTEVFQTKIRLYPHEQKALTEAMSIGRGLGDAFAWLFYMNSQDLLSDHFARPRVNHTPPGLGGIGELSFLNSVYSDTHFILYHGITTFLRIGDVSFIKLSNLKVTGIGELKTAAESATTAKVTAHVVAIEKSDLPQIYYLDQSPVDLPSPNGKHKINESTWKAREFSRLRRQINKISETLVKRNTDHTLKLHDAYHINELAVLEMEMATSKSAYLKLGSGLLLLGLRMDLGQKLSERLLASGSVDEIISPCRDLPQQVMQILDQNSKDNSVAMGRLSRDTTLGIKPVFWWEMNSLFLEQIYFEEVMLMTFYNSSFLLDALREKGFTVSRTESSMGLEYDVSISQDRVIGRLENFQFFIRLVTHQLMKEAVIVKTLFGLHSKTPKDGPTKVFINVAHHF